MKAAQIIGGISILTRYCDESESVQCGPDYVVFAPVDLEITLGEATQLHELGWHIQDGYWHIGKVK